MYSDAEKTYNGHAIFLSEIALSILEKKDEILLTPGVREIIAMYLLVPYITNDQLETPGGKCQIPKIAVDEKFNTNIVLGELRNAICHSFVSVEDSANGKKGRLVLDDRALMNRYKHDKNTDNSRAAALDTQETSERLIELHNEVINIGIKNGAIPMAGVPRRTDGSVNQ